LFIAASLQLIKLRRSCFHSLICTEYSSPLPLSWRTMHLATLRPYRKMWI